MVIDCFVVTRPTMTSSFVDLDAAATSEDGAGGYFFELANRDEVVYRCSDGVTKLRVGQDRDIVGCTGGIVWETAFLLSNYLRTHPWSGAASSSSSSSSSSASSSSAPSVLEVGAGCGLLGLAMAKDVTAGPVVMTEAPEAMVNLTSNVDRNNAAFVEAPSSGGQAGGGGEGAGGSGGGGAGGGGGRHAVAAASSLTAAASLVARSQPRPRVRALQLRWDVAADRAAVAADNGGPFDVVVGTDVVFNVALVGPLLDTILHLCHADTHVWMCVQERCADAHRELMRLAPEMFDFEDRTAELRGETRGSAPASAPASASAPAPVSTSSGRIAEELECYLFHLRPKAGRAGGVRQGEKGKRQREDGASAGETGECGSEMGTKKKKKKKKMKKGKKEKKEKG